MDYLKNNPFTAFLGLLCLILGVMWYMEYLGANKAHNELIKHYQGIIDKGNKQLEVNKQKTDSIIGAIKKKDMMIDSLSGLRRRSHVTILRLRDDNKNFDTASVNTVQRYFAGLGED